MMPKTALPAVKKLMTVHGGPSKAKPPGGDGQKRLSRDLGSRVSLLGGGPVHTGRKRSRTQATRQRPANTREEERKSRAKAPPVNKTATLGKTLTPKVPPMNKTATLGKTLIPKAPPMNKTVTLGKTLTPKAPPVSKTVTLGKTLTLPPRKAPSPEGVFSLDEAPAQGVSPEDEALSSKLVSSGVEALSLEKALTFEQMFSEEPSSGDNTQPHPFPDSAPSKSKTKGKSSLVHKPEEHPLDKRDSSALQLEATPGPLENLVQPWEEPTTLQEKTPAKDETTPKEEAPPEKVPQNPTVSKDDKEEVTKLQEEVESLRKALELMGEQLESKLMDIWEELKSERERHRLLEVQMNLRTKESLTPISSPRQSL